MDNKNIADQSIAELNKFCAKYKYHLIKLPNGDYTLKKEDWGKMRMRYSTWILKVQKAIKNRTGKDLDEDAAFHLFKDMQALDNIDFI